MKLLFDHNLSPGLVQQLADCFPEASHVRLLGLERAADGEVWTYAQGRGYAIVTKDSDFNDLSVLRGFPPKVVWIRAGNCTTADIESLLRRKAIAIGDFLASGSDGTLVIR